MLESEPIWNAKEDVDYSANYSADPETIRNVLYCFLLNTACDFFKDVLTFDKAQELGGLNCVMLSRVCGRTLLIRAPQLIACTCSTWIAALLFDLQNHNLCTAMSQWTPLPTPRRSSHTLY